MLLGAPINFQNMFKYAHHGLVIRLITPLRSILLKLTSYNKNVKNHLSFNKSLKLCLIILISGDKQLDGYQKKKYVCKLLFIFLLGNDVDFGHMEAVDLLASNKYTEKQIVS